MKLSDQLCTYLQAEALMLLGIEQTSVFYRHPEYNNPKTDSELYDKYGIEFKKVSLSLFTVAELGKMIGREVNDCKFHNPTKSWTYALVKNPGLVATQAECYALALIHLLRNNCLTAAECNKRLTAKDYFYK